MQDVRIDMDTQRTHVEIWIGKNGDLSDLIMCSSENGNYFFMQGTYYKNSDDEGTQNIALFTETELIYRKKYEETIDVAVISNDGIVTFFTDECNLVSLSPDGKQRFKRQIDAYFDDETCYISADYCYFCEDDRLIIYNANTKKFITKIIKDIDFVDEDGDEDTLYGTDTTFYKLENGFLFLYYDEKTAIKFDFDGNESAATEDDINKAIDYIKIREAEEKAAKERKQAQEKEFWKKREALAETLFTKFGEDKNAAIKFYAEFENVTTDIAETIVENTYTKYQLKLEHILKRQEEEKAKAKAEAREEAKRKKEYKKAHPSKPFEIVRIVFAIILLLLCLLLLFVDFWAIIGVAIGIVALVTGIKNLKKIKANKNKLN